MTVRRGPFALTCDDPGVPVDDAQPRLAGGRRRSGRRLGRRGEPRGVADRDLAKQIPMQAGLGGGSARCGGRAGRRWPELWRARIDDGRPAARSPRGSAPTCRYFLVGGTALGLGRGDELYPLADLAPRRVVLALPGVRRVDGRTRTGWFDEDRAGRPAGGRRRAGGAGSRAWPRSATSSVVNDLEAPVGPRVTRRSRRCAAELVAAPARARRR